jgi:hypothetical protein
LGVFMQKKLIQILLALIIFASLFSFANAVTLTGSASATLCQCETIKEQFSLCAQRIGGNYSVSINGAESNWVSIAQSQTNLAANSCADVFLFATPSCFGNSGEYNYTINVSGPETAKLSYKLTVNQCHSTVFDVTPAANSARPCEEKAFNISLKNSGAFTDEFVFSQSGLPSAWATYPQGKIVLAPNESYNSKLFVKSNCSADANTIPFTFSVSNTRTNASSTKNLDFVVQKIVPFSIGSLFSDQNSYVEKSCEEFDKNVSFVIKDLSGNKDEVSVSILDSNKNPFDKSLAYFEQQNVLIDFNIEAKINLIIKKQPAGMLSGYILAKSKTYDKNYMLPFTIGFENCYDLNLERDNNSSKECYGKISQGAKISNTGSQKLDLNFSVILDGVKIETKSFSVLKGETKIVNFILPPTSPKVSEVMLTADSAFAKKDLNYPFEFENCFNAQIELNNFGVCAGAPVDENVTISNSGTRAQKFLVSIDSNWLELSPDEFSILPGSSKTISLSGLAPINPSGAFTITASSDDVILKKEVLVGSLANEECNSLLVLAPESVIPIESCSGKVIDVNVTNTGYFDQNLSVKKISPPWISISEENFGLNKGETKSVFIYCSPDANSGGRIFARLLISNDKNVSKDVSIDLNVSPQIAFVLPNQVDINGAWKDNNAQLNYYVLSVVVKNDSNSGFSVNQIMLGGFNSYADFNKGDFISPGESLTAKVRVLPDKNGPVPVKDVNFIIVTSAGTFTKLQALESNGPQVVNVTGFFALYTVPLVGLLLVILLVLFLLALRAKLSKKKGKYETEDDESKETIYADKEKEGGENKKEEKENKKEEKEKKKEEKKETKKKKK